MVFRPCPQAAHSLGADSKHTNDKCHEVLRQKYDKVLEHKWVTDEHFLGKGQGGLHTLSAMAVPFTLVPYHQNLECWSTKDP